MEQRSICLINDSFPPVTDGVANAVVNYAKNLTQDGKRATVVTPAYPDADDTQFGFPVVRYPSVDLTKLVGYHAGLPFSSQTLEKLVEQRFERRRQLGEHRADKALFRARAHQIAADSSAEDRADRDRKDGDERVFAREHAVHADVEHAERRALFHCVAEALGDKLAEQKSGDAARDDRGGVDNGTGQDH